MFCAQPVVAGIALHAFIPIYGCAIDGGINVNRTHGTDIGAVPAGNAFIRIDFHDLSPIIDLLVTGWEQVLPQYAYHSTIIEQHIFVYSFSMAKM